MLTLVSIIISNKLNLNEDERINYYLINCVYIYIYLKTYCMERKKKNSLHYTIFALIELKYTINILKKKNFEFTEDLFKP